MAIQKPQTSPFPPISPIERTFAEDVGVLGDRLGAGAGAIAGLEPSFPVGTDAPLTPTFTDGEYLAGDRVLHVHAASWDATVDTTGGATQDIYFGLGGAYYDTLPAHNTDLKLAQVNLNTSNAIESIAVPTNQGAGRVGVKGKVHVGNATKGSAKTLYTLKKPENLTQDRARVDFALVETLGTVSGGGTGTNLVLSVNDTTAVTFTGASYSTLGANVVSTTPILLSGTNADTITVKYNQAGALASGQAGIYVEVIYF